MARDYLQKNIEDTRKARLPHGEHQADRTGAKLLNSSRFSNKTGNKVVGRIKHAPDPAN